MKNVALIKKKTCTQSVGARGACRGGSQRGQQVGPGACRGAWGPQGAHSELEKRKRNRQQKAVWDSGSLALLIKMSVTSIFLILRYVQGSGPEGDDVL